MVAKPAVYRKRENGVKNSQFCSFFELQFWGFGLRYGRLWCLLVGVYGVTIRLPL